MKDIHYSVKPNQSAKQQALQVIKLLKESIPIERAQMRLRVVVRGKETKKCKEKLLKIDTVELENEERDGDQLTVVFLVDPGRYREIDEMFKAETKGAAILEIMSFKEIILGDEMLM